MGQGAIIGPRKFTQEAGDNNTRPHHTTAVAAHGARRRRATRRRRPRPAAAAVGGTVGGVPRRKLTRPLRRLLRRRALPPRPLRRQPEEVRYAVRRLRGEGNLRVQALQGQRHHRVVSDARPRVRQSMPLPYLRWDQGSALLELPRKRLCLKRQCVYLDR